MRLSARTMGQSRQRWRIPALLVLSLVFLACPVISKASVDYGDDGGLPLSGSDGGEAMISNDDIYEPPQMQQEVEMEERRNEMATNDQDEESETPSETTVAPEMLRGNHLRPTKPESMGKRVAMAETEYADLAEDYEERDAVEMDKATTESAATTTISDYIRKGKKLPAEDRDTLATMTTTEKPFAKDLTKEEEYEDEQDVAAAKKPQSIPEPMKFYQDETDVQDSAEENKLKDSMVVVKQKSPKLRGQKPHDDDDYYDDSVETVDTKRVPAKQPQQTTTPTTTTTTTATMATPTNQVPNLVMARAIPLFDVLQGVLSPSTSAPATTTTTTTAVISPTLPPTALPTAQAVTAFLGQTPSPTATTTTITTTAATTTAAATMAAAGKQGKQITNVRRKLLPHEQLRNYIEDAYIRMPLAVIVDPSADSLDKTKALWSDALEQTPLNIKIVLVSLNGSGAPAAYRFNNTRQFLAGLNSIREHSAGDALAGVQHAAELVPYDSAVFISTATLAPRTFLVQDAAITLLKKRIRLYLMWYGERSLSENETQEAVGGVLGEVADRSGGDILHIVGGENSQEVEGTNALILVADAFRGPQEVDLPVDTTLSSLHVKIDAPMRSATLATPNGDINLRKLVKFKSLILTLGPSDKRLDAYVPLTKLHKSSTFKLKMIPDDLNEEYTVFVRAERKADLFLDDMIKRFDSFFLEGITSYPTRFHDTRLQSITTALAAASMPTHDNIKFADDHEDDEREELVNETEATDDSEPKAEVETFSEEEVRGASPTVTEAPLNTTLLPRGGVAAKSQEQSILQRNGGTVIVMGLQSQVLVAPGMMAQLFFELTNTRSTGIYHNIQVVDERRFLLRLAPGRIYLMPGQTATVSVTLLVHREAVQGTTDRITFTCQGAETSSLSLNVKVVSSLDSRDTVAPSVSWQFGGRCENVDTTDTSRCADRFWTLDITAQDWETGILRLASTPSTSLYYRNSYTVGSTEPVKATYLATCCEPKVTLTAYDISGNQRTYKVDVRDMVLTEASIAAIVLGALLLLLLIVVLIVSLVYCYRRRKISLDLPTYRSHSTRSME